MRGGSNSFRMQIVFEFETVSELAERSKATIGTVVNQIQRGRIQAYRAGPIWLIPATEANAYIARHKVEKRGRPRKNAKEGGK